MWYAVWVRSGQEDRVTELCKTFRHYHPDAYEECFIPTYEKYRKVKRPANKTAGSFIAWIPLLCQ